MRSTWPSTALSSSWATGELAAASSRASRPSALPDAYCSQQPRLPHSQRWPPGMMIWWPNSPATPKRPRSSRPSITMAPPIPVPSVMQTRRFWPCPAPKRHSAQPAASASLVSSTGRRSRRCRLSRRGSLRHARWGLNSTVPPSRSIQPAAPIPTDQIRWPAPSSSTSSTMTCSTARGSLPGVDRLAWARILPSASTTPAATLVPPMSTPMARPFRPSRRCSRNPWRGRSGGRPGKGPAAPGGGPAVRAGLLSGCRCVHGSPSYSPERPARAAPPGTSGCGGLHCAGRGTSGCSGVYQTVRLLASRCGGTHMPWTTY